MRHQGSLREVCHYGLSAHHHEAEQATSIPCTGRIRRQDCHAIVQVAVKLMLGRCEQELALRAGMVSRAGSICNLTPFSQVCLLAWLLLLAYLWLIANLMEPHRCSLQVCSACASPLCKIAAYQPA